MPRHRDNGPSPIADLPTAEAPVLGEERHDDGSRGVDLFLKGAALLAASARLAEELDECGGVLCWSSPRRAGCGSGVPFGEDLGGSVHRDPADPGLAAEIVLGELAVGVLGSVGQESFHGVAQNLFGLGEDGRWPAFLSIRDTSFSWASSRDRRLAGSLGSARSRFGELRSAVQIGRCSGPRMLLVQREGRQRSRRGPRCPSGTTASSRHSAPRASSSFMVQWLSLPKRMENRVRWSRSCSTRRSPRWALPVARSSAAFSRTAEKASHMRSSPGPKPSIPSRRRNSLTFISRARRRQPTAVASAPATSAPERPGHRPPGTVHSAHGPRRHRRGRPRQSAGGAHHPAKPSLVHGIPVESRQQSRHHDPPGRRGSPPRRAPTTGRRGSPCSTP